MEPIIISSMVGGSFTLLGFIVANFWNSKEAEKRRNDEYKILLAEKKLETAQTAYNFATKLKRAIHGDESNLFAEP